MPWVRPLREPPSPLWEPPVGDDRYTGVRARGLAAELDRRWSHRVTVLHGRAGRGKTVAVARALDAHLHSPVGLDVWFSCEPFDATGEHLGGEILGVLAEHRGDHARDRQGVPPAPPSSLPGAIADAIWSLAPQEVCLTVDSMHLLPPGSPALRLLRHLARLLPANGHLLLVGRALATIATVAHPGDRDVHLVDAAHLAPPPPGPDADLLSQDQVDALALARAVGPLDEATARTVLGRPVRLQRTLAGLPYVLRSGAYHVVHEAWDEVIADVAEVGDRAPQWRSAAVALARLDGDLDRAFHLAAGLGDWSQAVAVLTDACRTMLYDAGRYRLDQWLPLLPEPRRGEPVVRLAEALTDHTLHDGVLRTRLKAAADALRLEGRTDLELVALARLGVLAWRAGDRPGFDQHVDRMAQIAADGDRDAAQLIALGRLMHAEGEGGTSTMWRLLEELSGDGFDGPMRSMLARYRAVVELQYGAPERVLTLTAQAESDVVVRELRYEMAVTRAWALWFLGRTDDAVATVEGLLIGGPDVTDVVVTANGELMRALLGRQSPGPRSSPEALEARAERARAQGMVGPHAGFALAAAARLVNDGDEDAARQVLVRALTGPSGGPRTSSAATRALSLPYVLLGGLPPGLVEDDLGDGPRAGLAAARALVALREGRRGGADLAAVALADPALTPTHLPPVWAIELALRATWHRVRGEEDRSRADGTVPRATATVDRLVAAAGPAGSRALRVLARSPVPRLRDAARRTQNRRERRPVGAVTVRLLGPVRIERAGEESEHPDWRRERVRALLALLVRRGSVSRAEACDRLWPDLDPDAANNNLRVTLSYLHRVLGGPGTAGRGDSPLRADGAALRLAPEVPWTVDVVELDRLLDQAERSDSAGDLPRAIALAGEALTWYRGPYLADLRATAADELEGDRLRSRVVQALVRLGALLAAAGDLAEAQRRAVAALEIDPWSEHAAALEISTYLARGDRPAAERAYRRCRDALAELDLEPSEVVERVVQRLRGAAPPRPTLTG